MKNLNKIISLSLCVAMILVAAVACVDKNGQYDDYEDHTSGKSDDSDTGFVTAPPVEDETEDNAYINAAPANDEQGWGPLTPRP